MIFREAKIDDIKQIQDVLNSVKENTLSNPDLVTDKDCEEFLTVNLEQDFSLENRGKLYFSMTNKHL